MKLPCGLKLPFDWPKSLESHQDVQKLPGSMARHTTFGAVNVHICLLVIHTLIFPNATSFTSISLVPLLPGAEYLALVLKQTIHLSVLKQRT